MPANKMRRSAVLVAIDDAAKADVIVPNDFFWRRCAPGTVELPPVRGYVTGECVDEALIRQQAEQGRELMKEITWNS